MNASAPKPQSPSNQAPAKGVLLEELTWIEAEYYLRQNPVVVVPIGASSKEHGPHLPLNNDWILAEYFKMRVLMQCEVVVAPTIAYHYYPAFLDYPGTISLCLETARDLVVDICAGLAAHGPQSFYALNIGHSALRALSLSAELLGLKGISLKYSRPDRLHNGIDKQIQEQEGGNHADELETSMMLYIAPERVNMKKALKDYNAQEKGLLSRAPKHGAAYSLTGIWGDPTLATREKGELLVETMVREIVLDIEALQKGMHATSLRFA